MKINNDCPISKAARQKELSVTGGGNNTFSLVHLQLFEEACVHQEDIFNFPSLPNQIESVGGGNSFVSWLSRRPK